MKKILFIFGTRPEAIKMAPIIKRFAISKEIDPKVCITAQHREMLDSILVNFNIVPDYDLNIIKPNQNLNDISRLVIGGLDEIFKKQRFDYLFVHGDTSTTLAASIAGFHSKIPLAHVEAGLRTGNFYSPWPEEMNRVLTDSLASIFFPPTESAMMNLIREGKDPNSICVTGNTVIDALIYSKNIILNNDQLRKKIAKSFPFLDDSKKLILVTGHRRESFGEGFERICTALLEISKMEDVQIIYPVHMNPNVREPVKRILSNSNNIFLIEPQDYFYFIYLMIKCDFILTDSGGIQEEAPTLGKPVLLLRDTSERPEAIDAGTVKMVGTDVTKIVAAANKLLEDKTYYNKMSAKINPYGDGSASEKILEFILGSKI